MLSFISRIEYLRPSLALLAAMFVSVSVSSVHAQGRCEEYAAEAVEAAERNIRERCGFTGARWIPNPTPHLFWCRLAPRDNLRSEAEARREELARCAGGRRGDRDDRRDRRDDRGDVEGKRAGCDTYAKMAVVQAEANRQFRCDFRGPQWTREYEPHFRWCRNVRRSSLAEDFRNRAVELQRCFDKLGDFDDDSWDRGRR